MQALGFGVRRARYNMASEEAKDFVATHSASQVFQRRGELKSDGQILGGISRSIS